MSHTDEHAHDDHEHAHTTVAGYIGVFLVLLVGTALTVATAKANFGGVGLALLIAVSKASFVLYFFMHLRESPKIIKGCGVMGFLFLGILLMFFITDSKGQKAERSSPVEAKEWPSMESEFRQELGYSLEYKGTFHEAHSAHAEEHQAGSEEH